MEYIVPMNLLGQDRPADPRNYTELNPWWKNAVRMMVARTNNVSVVGVSMDTYGRMLAEEARLVRIRMGWFDYGYSDDEDPAAGLTQRRLDPPTQEYFPIPALCNCPQCMGALNNLWHRIASAIDGENWWDVENAPPVQGPYTIAIREEYHNSLRE